MKNKINLFKPIYVVLLTVSATVVLLTAFTEKKQIFLIAALLWLCAFCYMLFKLGRINREIDSFLQQMGKLLADVQSAALTEFPIPVLVARGNKEIVWYNEMCREKVLGGTGSFGHYIDDLLPDISLDAPCPPSGYSILYGGRMYTVFLVTADRGRESMYVLYFMDDHDLKVCANEYFESRPAVMLMIIDNYEEIFQGAKENERGAIVGQIEESIENFTTPRGGMMRKTGKDAYLVMLEERYMRDIVDARFSILDKIRSISVGDKMPPTMSIGVGRDAKTLKEAEQMARQSLDMALGRGGDQAAVKTKTGYEFYGGTSKAIEKRNKVRTRVISSALSEIIHSSSNVIVMGHRFGDLDSLGASIGMAKAVELQGKTAYIAMCKGKTLAVPLYNNIMQNGYNTIIIEPEAALEHVDENTLLVVVDTHVASFVESPALYKKCKRVVVIDHHRKMVGHIEDTLIFYHEPYASSASEMVAELLQYMTDEEKLTPHEADALLAGVTLDTKNFTIRTGVRTFEAAAYLRRMGADTVRVRGMFASSIEAYRERSKLVSAAEVYSRCAIACSDTRSEELRIVAPQAADELLNISEVDASFLIYEIDEGVSISARSMGKINVQLIMEAMGGGGHQTMAGAQLAGKSAAEVRQELIAAIDLYGEQHLQN